MSLIDWSDPEEMLGLLIEYVDDEAAAAQHDVERTAVLRELSRDLARVADQDGDIAAALREIHDAQPREFAGDPVMTHVAACIDELDRIRAQSR